MPCCVQSCYAVLSFYLLMPFVFMSLFTSDKRFFAADTTARLYHPFQYYMAKVTVTLPFNMIVAIVFHLVYYGMIGMRHGVEAMGKSCVISVLMGLTAMQVSFWPLARSVPYMVQDCGTDSVGKNGLVLLSEPG